MGPTVAHAGGSSLDEFVSQAMLFAAIALGVAGWLAHGRAAWWRSWGFVGLGVAVAAGAFVVPQRYLRATPATVRPAAGSAMVDILSPADGAVVRGDTLQAAVNLENMRLVETSRSARTGEGHVHIFVDGRLLSMAGGPSNPIDISAFRPGAHTLTFELVAADHGPFDPRVRDSITFTKETG